jgi:diguanylate cyclase (GGDEF)-like protein
VENTRESDVVGRIGGDEFGVILSQADEKAAYEKAETLVQALRGIPAQWEGHEIPVDVAYGVYTLSPGEDAGDALAKVDKAMYANKADGKSGR